MKNLILIFSFFLVGTLTFMNSCTYKSKEELLNTITCDSTNVKYGATIQPLITTYCNAQSGCHGANAGSISLLTYQNVFDHVDNVLSEIVSGDMPKNASKLDACTIGKFQNWVNQGAPNN